MKKIFSLVMLSMLILLPMNTKAATSIVVNCGEVDDSGTKTCTIAYDITGDPVDSLTVTLTEKGGAEVTDVVDATESEWSVSSKQENDGVWTVVLASVGLTGEGNLFTFSYKPSGQEDCTVEISLEGQTIQTPIPTPDPEPTPDDTPTDNKQTGATLPYIALGTIAVIATGAYLATKNKSKMYRI